MNFALRYAVRSDVGLLREGNEDSAYAGPHLLAVADGMGGYEAGEVASACVIQSIAPLDRSPMPESHLIDAISDAVTTAKQNLHGIVEADPAVGSMGTTLTAMLWSGDTAAICHIGDSRAYLLRAGDLYQITRDHTFVQALIDQGRIRPEEAATHPQRSLLLRALDGRTDADPDLSLLTAELGDRFLLCSDGLPVAVSDEAILDALAEFGDPAQAVLELVELAIAGGGPDNITCIVADVIDTDRSQSVATRAPVLAGAVASVTNDDTKAFSLTPSDHDGGGMTRVGATPGVAGGWSPGTDITALAGSQQAMAAGVGQATQTGPGSAQGFGPGGTRPGRIPTQVRPPDDAEENATYRPPRRRRVPIVGLLLALFVVIVGGGLVTGYLVVHSQYYVGSTTDGKVAIFRGINDSVLGYKLYSVYKPTNIPVSGIPEASAAELKRADTGSLAMAQQFLGNIAKQYNTCQSAEAKLQTWEKNKPTKKVKVHIRVNGKPRTVLRFPPYPPKPTIPAFCPAQPTTGT
ncbi:MAG TPA: protein phosphatase 2C domain-containing protein [Streptosporangiaceae bacterium]|nr:protein phosphatase 2C domain-containing protein [Streptosporangiaceae bacterium]